MAQAWTSPEAFEHDLFAFSEIEGAQEDSETTVPQSLLEWEARNGVHHQSVFDAPDLSEDVTYVVSGRGRGGISTIIKPGAATKVTQNLDEDIKKKIREVSGAGFSNALIEQSVRNRNTITGAVNPEIKLQPVVTSYKSSASSSSSNRTRLHTPTMSSRDSTPSATPKKSSVANSNLSRSSSFSSVSEPELEPVVETPVPLSTMLKNAKKNVRRKAAERLKKPEEENRNGDKKDETKENVDMNDVWWTGVTSNGDEGFNSWRRRDVDIPNRFFGCVGNKDRFNIGSSEDFPALK